MYCVIGHRKGVVEMQIFFLFERLAPRIWGTGTGIDTPERRA